MTFSLIGIGAGGALGAITRFYLGRVTMRKWGRSFPLGTFLINLTGSFLLCLFSAWTSWNTNAPSFLRSGITVGFLGSYTTFSTFSYETIKLLEDGEFITAFAYLLGSILLGLVAAWLGFLTGYHL